MTELRGITWNHTRGFVPLVATAQRFSELHPDVEIRWEKRSLQDFADSRVDKLAERYDLLVIDHPVSGYVSRTGGLLPLDEYLPREFLLDQSANSVGKSHRSYEYAGHQWALAIDAAAPVCGYRPDLLERAGATVPSTWSELLELARRGLVVMPGIGIDSLMNFYMLCGAVGEAPFASRDRIIGDDAGMTALQMLKNILDLCDKDCLRRNPIATWNLLTDRDTVALCPFAYGYSNYARAGYGSHPLEFCGLVRTESGGALRSTLGGAGLAISSKCAHREEAVRYAQYVASADCQRTVYFDSGGQPGHRSAWLDSEVNRRSSNFFANTVETLDAAYLRPRYAGYLDFQDEASVMMHSFVSGAAGPRETLAGMNRLYQETFTGYATA